MASAAAVAKALLEAGNIEGAEREALTLLDRAPHDRDALEILISVALERCDHKRALSVADDWIAREPDCNRAHKNRIHALFDAGKKRAAREALERYKSDFPQDRLGYESMQVDFETAAGKPEAAIQQIDALRKKYDGLLQLDEAEAIAKSRSGRLIAASRAADRVLEKNPINAVAHFVKARNAYQLCRFGKARALARETRKVEPRLAAQINELIYASYAVYFPPFLVTHVLWMLMVLGKSRLPKILYVLYLIVIALALQPLLGLIDFLADTTGITSFPAIFYLSMVGWGFYSLVIFQRFSSRRTAAQPVDLARTY